jgi:hypothetical protein
LNPVDAMRSIASTAVSAAAGITSARSSSSLRARSRHVRRRRCSGTAQDEPRDLIRASIRARAVAAPTVWRVPACNSSIAARRSSRRPGVASRSASASAETQSSSGIECTTGLSVALRLSRRTTEIARPGRIGARLRDDAGRLSRLSRNWSRARSCPHSMGKSAPKVAFRPHLGPHSGPGLGLAHHR